MIGHIVPIGLERLQISLTITYWFHFDYFGPLCYLIVYDYGSLIHI